MFGTKRIIVVMITFEDNGSIQAYTSLFVRHLPYSARVSKIMKQDKHDGAFSVT